MFSSSNEKTTVSNNSKSMTSRSLFSVPSLAWRHLFTPQMWFGLTLCILVIMRGIGILVLSFKELTLQIKATWPCRHLCSVYLRFPRGEEILESWLMCTVIKDVIKFINVLSQLLFLSIRAFQRWKCNNLKRVFRRNTSCSNYHTSVGHLSVWDLYHLSLQNRSCPCLNNSSHEQKKKKKDLWDLHVTLKF